MFKNLHKQQKGFTLIEVLVVVGILAILLAITLIALNPATHFADTRNTQRSSDVTAILDGIYQYQAENKGSLPSVVQSLTAGTTYYLSNDTVKHTSNTIDLCSSLVPGFIADLPLDPNSTYGARTGATTCAAGGTYDTGYTLKSSTSNRFTISAPGAENGANISVTR